MDEMKLWDKIFLTWAALCLLVGLSLLAGCKDNLFGDNQDNPSHDKTSVPVEYGTPK